jgi:hypothetical protein
MPAEASSCEGIPEPAPAREITFALPLGAALPLEPAVPLAARAPQPNASGAMNAMKGSHPDDRIGTTKEKMARRRISCDLSINRRVG